MATVKVKFRPSTIEGHEGTVYYQIIHNRKSSHFFTPCHLLAEEWNEKSIRIPPDSSPERHELLVAIRDRIHSDIERFTKIIRRLDDQRIDYEAADVVTTFRHYQEKYSLFNYLHTIIGRLKQNGKVRTAETYRATLNSFRTFRRNEDLMLDALSSSVMEAYEAWLRQRGLAPNTISFYTRILRAVYNRAVEEDAIINRYPFRHVYTGIGKTVKRALPLPIIKNIKNLDLALQPRLDFARDIFMLSFMLRGMSLIDMAYLKKSDLHSDHIIYRRRKTGQLLTIEWTPDMQRILDKYPTSESDYLLPIIRAAGINPRWAYRNAGYNINRSLKKIAEMLGIRIPLTLYVARHSWASAAKTKGIPISVISEGMGHDSETTTQIYLSSLDTSTIDRANALILRSI